MSGVLVTHLRLLLRSGTTWAVAALAGILLPAIGRFPTSSGNLAVVLNMWLPVSALLFMFVGIFGAQLDRRQKVDEVVRSLPVTPARYIGGQMAAVALAAVAIETLQVAAAVGIGLLKSGAVIAPGLLAGAWASAISVAAVAAVLGYVAGLLGGGVFAPLTFCALLWAAVVLSSTVLMDMLRNRPTIGMLVDFTSSQQSTLTWHLQGRFPNEALVGWNRALWGGLALLLAGVAIGVWSRRRTSQRRFDWRLWLPAAAGAVLAAVAALNMDAIVMGRHAAYAAEAAAFSPDLAPRDVTSRGQSTEYRIALNLTPSDHRVQAEARVTVQNTGTEPAGELLFTLHPDFTVEAVEGAAAHARQGQFVRVQLQPPLPPGQQTALTFRYAGAVMQWRKDNFHWMNSGLLASHVTPASLTLSGNAGWYPQPARQPLAWATPVQGLTPGLKAPLQLTPFIPRGPEASFALTVTGWNRPLFTNLTPDGAGGYTGTAQSAWLVGGDLAAFGNDRVQLLVPPEMEQHALKMAGEQAPVVERLEALVPRKEPGPLRFVAVGGRSAFGVIEKAAGEPLVAPGAVAMRNVYAVSPLPAWWPALGQHVRPEQNKVELALADLMARTAGIGDDPALKRVQEGQDPALLALTGQIEARGPEAVKAVLRDLYNIAKQRELTPEDLQRAAGAGGN